MDEVIDDLDFENDEVQDGVQSPPEQKEVVKEDDFIDQILKSKGIEDKSKIKFENESGEVEEVDWNSLSNEDKINIFNSSTAEGQDNNGLDEAETDLINTIRQSKLTPAEYLQKIEKDGVDRYLSNQQSEYLVDQYSDDELFVADLMSRLDDISEEEAREALEKAKSNEILFAKQIGALRKEYRTIEEENQKQEKLEKEYEAQEQFDRFKSSVEKEINSLTNFSGYDLNLDDDDKQELYEFLTGVDAAGNNHFAKALSDPATLVKAALLVLNGEQMFKDITDYFQKEITNVRKESFKKGQADVVYQKKDIDKREYLDDLD